MIELARDTDKDAIILLWANCFGDSIAYIEQFLDKRFDASRCLIYRDSGRIVSMMFLLEGSLRTGGFQRKACYIYAACTHPRYRKRGIMAALMQRAQQEAGDLGAGSLCLVPSKESLFSFYARFGFQSRFSKKIVSLSRNSLQLLAQNERCEPHQDFAQIYGIRMRSLEQNDAFIWDAQAVAYALEEALFNGLEVANAGTAEKECYAIVDTKSEIAEVREALCAPSGLPTLASLLLQMTPAAEFRIHLPLFFPLSADNCLIVSNGMELGLDITLLAGEQPASGGAYIGLTLE